MTKPTAGNKPAKTTKKSAFSRITSAAKRAISPPTSPQDRSVSSGIAAVFVENAKLPVALGEAHSKSPSRAQSTIVDTPAKKELISISKAVQLRTDIFPKNEIKPAVRTLWPKFNDRINTTPQLVLCATLLPKESTPEAEDLDEATDPSDETIKQATIESAPREWVKALEDPIEQKRIVWIARGIVKKFANDATNDLDDVAEIALLGPILDREYYRELLTCAIRKFEDSDLLKESLLQGLVQLVQSAQPGYLEADDLTTILSILRRRLQGTHLQSTKYLYQLTLAVSSVLDIMAENKVRDLDRILEHEPLSAVLSGLGRTSDPYLLYQASYAFQALQYVPDNETTGQALLRHGTGVLDSMVKLSSVLKLDIGEFFEGLKGIHEVAGSIYEGAKTGYESICSLIESGQGVLESLKEGLGSGQKLRWYSAVRRGEAFVREGRLADFGRLVCEAPCRRDPFFQWGICQLLAEIATDSNWEVDTRQQAVDFLHALFKDDAEWGQDESVRTWTLTLLERISTMPIDSFAPTRDTSRHDQAVKEHARTLLKDLKTDLVDSTFRAPYPLKSRLPLPRSSRLLKLVQDIPYIDYDLAMLKRQRLSENHQKLYIPPQAKAHLKASDDDTFPLMEYVEEFLASNCLVLLILGDSFNRHLEQTLWKKYRPDRESDPIPLYINLAAVNSSEHDMIGKQLARYYITDPNKVEELKEHREFILICDGYDELGSMQNLHALNKLNQGRGHWRAKMVITCRSAFLGDTTDYLRQFKPLTNDNYNNRYAAERLQEAVITPFTEDQVQDYIDQYVLVERPERPNWPAQRYKDVLMAMPSLMDLVKNPFLLTLALDAMPRLVSDDRDLSQIKVNRLVLYDIVVEEWIEVAADRLAAGGLTNAERDAFDLLHSGGFRLNVMDHLKKLATEIFENQNGNPYVEYLERRHKETWKAKFFGRNPETTVLRLSSPLVRSGAMNSFIHLSVLDYFFARVVYDPEESTVGHPCLSKHAFAQGTIVSYPSILQFLAERVQQDPEDIFKKQLLQIIEDSKTDDKESHAAANAITILVKAGVRFNGVDLRGIRVPGADLTGGQFDSAQLQGADLTGATLTRAWIHQADFSHALMAGVRFGELPHLTSPFMIYYCCYSPDGRTFAVGLANGNIDLYESKTWKKTRTLSGHTDPILNLVYSPNSQHIVSGGHDCTVRLWNLQSDEPGLTLNDYPRPVAAVAFSPSGQLFASASDTTIWIREAKTGATVFELKGHTATASAVAFSPNGLNLVSSGNDSTIRVWDLETGAPGLVFGNGHRPAFCLAYSPDANGQQIVSGHTTDGKICLWDATTGDLSRTLPGHASGVSKMVNGSLRLAMMAP
ncbi:WD domain protein [Mortierella sp. AD031]|nr:WD domain protein [Mortierella sp. AD031]